MNYILTPNRLVEGNDAANMRDERRLQKSYELAKLRARNAELLAALQDSADYLHVLCLTQDAPTSSHCGQAERKARAAIAKAREGKS